METSRAFLPFLSCVVGLLLIGAPGSNGETEQNCLVQAGACQTPLATVAQQAEGGTPSLEQLCPLYPQVKTCMAALDASCQSVAIIVNMTSALNMGSAGCDALSGGGSCPGAMTCFAAMSATGTSLQCQSMRDLTTCLKNLKQAPASCSFDESKVTFAKLESLLTDFCTDVAKFPEQEFNCSAADACTSSSPELGLSTLSGPNTDFAAALAVVKRLANPPELCKILEVGVGCAVTSKDACQYKADFVAAMTTLKQKLKAGCAGGDGSGTGGAAKTSGNIMLWLAVSLAAVLTSLV